MKTQAYLEEINQLTVSQKREINQAKTKAMFINFTDKYQCSSILTLKGDTIELVNSIQIHGVTVSNDLSWHENTAILLKKKGKSKNATTQSSMECWLQYLRNGSFMETVLPQYS